MLKVIEDNKLLTKNQIGVLYGVASVACFAMMDASCLLYTSDAADE